MESQLVTYKMAMAKRQVIKSNGSQKFTLTDFEKGGKLLAIYDRWKMKQTK